MSHEVSIEHLMRFFDCDLSESERWTVARRVTLSERLHDQLIFLEAVRSGFQDPHFPLSPSGSSGALPADRPR